MADPLSAGVVVTVAHLAPPFSGGIGAAIEGLTGIEGLRHLRVGDDAIESVEHASLVHCHHALSWRAARALSRRLGVAAVMSVHVLQLRQARMRGIEASSLPRSARLQAQAIAEADRLTIGSHAAREMLLEDHPELEPGRVAVLPPPSRLRPLDRRPGAVDGPIVAVTRFDWLKGTDLLVDLVARVLARTQRSVVIAGGLPHNPRAERRWREAFVAALRPDQTDRLRFAGWLDAGRLADLLAGAGLFVTTSRLETYGLALAEALAAGCPAVATDIGPHREVGGSSVRYAVPRVEALFHAVELELSDPRASTPHHALSSAGQGVDWLHFWRHLI